MNLYVGRTAQISAEQFATIILPVYMMSKSGTTAMARIKIIGEKTCPSDHKLAWTV
jgi:hypothetical protein